MRYATLSAALLLAASIASLSPATANAQVSGVGFGGGHFDGLGVGIGGLYRSLDYPTERRVPYFAARPPVYYSMPVPRTYGYSPFAYSPFEVTPPIAPEVKPIIIENPHTKADADSDAVRSTSGRTDRSVSAPAGQIVVTKRGPLTILNPFVHQPDEEVEYH